MMFFTGLGAGTVYWAFLEWGYHFNAAPALAGAEISEAYSYELSLTYAIYDWGPTAWALLCIFVLPFAYHYYIKKDDELRFGALCKYSLGEKFVNGWFGKIVKTIVFFKQGLMPRPVPGGTGPGPSFPDGYFVTVLWS